MYTARELRHQLIDSGAKAIVVMEMFAHVVAEVIADTPVKAGDHHLRRRPAVLPEGRADELRAPAREEGHPRLQPARRHRFREALALGERRAPAGSRHPPRGRRLPAVHRGTTAWPRARCSRTATWSRTCSSPRPGSARTGVPGKEIIITALPLYHIFALTSNCLVFMKFGGLNYLITNPRDMKGFVKEIARSRFTAITGVNTLFNGLLHTPGFDKIDFPPRTSRWAAAWRCSARWPSAGSRSPA
jgi:long-chain acyl-CoA synthetase